MFDTSNNGVPDQPQRRQRKAFASNITVGSPGLNTDDLRHLASRHPEEFLGKTQKLIDKGKLRWQDVSDLRGLFQALADVQVPCHVNVMGQQRAIMASAFPLLAGGLTVAGVNEAYDMVPTIGGELVTELQDNKRFTQLANILSEDTQIDRVDEGKDFPEIGAGEEKYTIAHKRNGRRLSITAETIEENDVANIVERVNALGEIAAELVEEQTLRRVCDIDGSGSSAAEPYVLHLGGAAQSLYVTTNTTLTRLPSSGSRYTDNALVDETDLENVRSRLAGVTNSRGKRIAIPVSRMTLLVPDALVGTALKIMNSEMVPGVFNEVSNWGPRGPYRPRLRSTPKLDDLSTTAWYLGWFERQFVRKWKLSFEFVTLSGDTESFLRSRLAFQARVAWDVEVGARDYVYVVQSLSGTTAP